MNEIIKGYEHIDISFDKAFQYIDDVRFGRLIPLLTSLKAENELLRGLLPTDQLTIAARTGMGKSSRAIHMMNDFLDVNINPSYKDRLIILYDSFEMASWRNALKLLSIKSEKTVHDLLNYEDKMKQEQFDSLKMISQQFKGCPLYIKEYSESVSEWINTKAEIAKKYPYPKYQIVNILDHCRLIVNDTNSTEEQLLNRLMKSSIRVKKQHNMINIFLSQMNRKIEDDATKDSDVGKRLPMASHIFGSDSIFQASDMVMALHRPGFYNLKTFEMNGSILHTGLTSESTDNLMIEVVMKNRNGNVANLVINHDIKYNKFSNFVDITQHGFI